MCLTAFPKEVSTFLPWALTLGLPMIAVSEDKLPKLSKNLWVQGQTTRSLWDENSDRQDERSEYVRDLTNFSFRNTLCLSASFPHLQYLPSQDLTSNHIHIHLGPQASNSSLLLSSKMHHSVWVLSIDHRGDRSKSVLLTLCVAFYSSFLAPRLLLLPMK